MPEEGIRGKQNEVKAGQKNLLGFLFKQRRTTKIQMEYIYKSTKYICETHNEKYKQENKMTKKIFENDRRSHVSSIR